MLAQGAGHVQGESPVHQVVHVLFIEEIDAAGVVLAGANKGLLRVIGNVLRVELLARGGVVHVARKLLVAGQAIAVQNVLHLDGRAQLEVAEAAARALLEVLARGHALDHAAHPLGGNAVRIVLHLHQNEAAVAAVLLVQLQHGVGRCAAAGE